MDNRPIETKNIRNQKKQKKPINPFIMSMLGFAIGVAVCVTVPQLFAGQSPSGGDQAQNNATHQHVFTEWEIAAEASCVKEGMLQSLCECGETVSHKLPAFGHIEVFMPYVAPTCAKTGLEEGKKCTVCGDFTVPQKTISKLPHTLVTDKGYAATKTENGLTDGSHCSVCGEITEEQKIIYGGSQGLEYEQTSRTTCKITGLGTCKDTDVVIPEYIEGLSVTAIDRASFLNLATLNSIVIPKNMTDIPAATFDSCSSITNIFVSEGNMAYKSIDGVLFKYDEKTIVCCPAGKTGDYIIPAGVTHIGNNAFASCDNLTNIIIPEGVTEIGDFAFAWSDKIVSLEIPDSVKNIGKNAFYCCFSLASLEIPAGVESIGEDAFIWCNALTNITVAAGNKAYKSIDGVLFTHDAKTLICHPISRTEEYTIPNGVTHIANDAFDSNKLTGITIPDSVISIGDNAFSFCYGIKSIEIPDSVVIIGQGAFYGCHSLTSLEIPNSVTAIGDSAFSYCNGLTDLKIPDNVKTVNAYTFEHCSGLKTLEISEGVASLGNRSFEDCPNLTSIKIPHSVTNIGSWTFQDCKKLTSITYNGTVEEWKALTKGTNWDKNTPDYTVTCTNGTVTKNGTVSYN